MMINSNSERKSQFRLSPSARPFNPSFTLIPDHCERHRCEDEAKSAASQLDSKPSESANFQEHDNVNSSGAALAINNNNFSTSVPADIMELCVVMNVKDKIVSDETTCADGGEEKRKCGPQDIAFGHGNKIDDKLTQELRVAESGVSLMSDQNDSDVDSPCWKGTGTNQSSIFGVVGATNSPQPKMDIEAHKCLNPLAPHFVPASAKQVVKLHKMKCDENYLLSKWKTMPSVVTLPSIKQRPTDSLRTQSCVLEESTVIGTQISGKMNNARREYQYLPKKSERNSVCHQSHLDGSVKGSKDVIHIHSGRTSVVTDKCLCSVGGVSSNIYETRQGASNSSCAMIDHKLVINTMRELSKLLVNGSYAMNEGELNMIQRIINNLYTCIKNEIGQKGFQLKIQVSRALFDHHKVCCLYIWSVISAERTCNSLWLPNSYTKMNENSGTNIKYIG